MMNSVCVNIKKSVKTNIRKVSLTETLYALEKGLPLYVNLDGNWVPYNYDEDYTISDVIRDLNHKTFGLERVK